jgi:hypothetical protein
MTAVVAVGLPESGERSGASFQQRVWWWVVDGSLSVPGLLTDGDALRWRWMHKNTDCVSGPPPPRPPAYALFSPLLLMGCLSIP